MEVLGGSETVSEKVRKKEGMMMEEEIEDKKIEDINKEEIYAVMRRMKTKKATGLDDMEARLFGSEAVKHSLVELLKKVWKEGRMPVKWRRSIIVSLHKRGDVNDTGNYRGISLLCSAYKIFAEILKRRLEHVIGTCEENLPARQDLENVAQQWIIFIY